MTEEAKRPEGTNVPIDENPEIKEVVIPFEQYRSLLASMDSLDNEWDDSQSIGKNLVTAIKNTVSLPDSDIQLGVAASYLLTPSALSDAVFNLFLYGQPGTGKTDFSEIVSGLHDSPIYASTTTFVALRNSIEQQRWRIKNVQENNYCCIFDNLPNDVFNSKPDLYNLFLIGVRRRSDLISISSGKSGENLEFRVFGLKVLNSKFPLFLNTAKHDSSEFRDRCLIIWFEKNKNFVKSVNSCHDWSFLNEKYSQFWQQDNSLAFIQLKAETKKKLKKKTSGNRKWLLAQDLIVTGVVTGVFADLEDAISHFSNFLEYQESRIAQIINPLLFTLRDYCELRKSENEKVNAEFTKLGLPSQKLEISSESLKTQLEIAKQEGLIDSFDARQTSLAMEDLGFILVRSERTKKLVWVMK